MSSVVCSSRLRPDLKWSVVRSCDRAVLGRLARSRVQLCERCLIRTSEYRSDKRGERRKQAQRAVGSRCSLDPTASPRHHDPLPSVSNREEYTEEYTGVSAVLSAVCACHISSRSSGSLACVPACQYWCDRCELFPRHPFRGPCSVRQQQAGRLIHDHDLHPAHPPLARAAPTLASRSPCRLRMATCIALDLQQRRKAVGQAAQLRRATRRARAAAAATLHDRALVLIDLIVRADCRNTTIFANTN